MKKLIMAGMFCILCSPGLYAQSSLVLAKLQDVSDQYIGEFILKRAYGSIGIDLIVEILPAKRALQFSTSGYVDGEIQRINVIERSSPTLIRIPTAVNYVDLSVFFTKQMPFRSMEDLEDYKFVYVRGVKVYESFLKYFKISHAVTTDEQMWRMIKERRMDVALAGRISGMYKLKELGIEGIYPLAPPQKTYHLYHYLHEKHQNLVPKIDAVLKKLSQNGELERLRAQAVENLLSGIATK